MKYKIIVVKYVLAFLRRGHFARPNWAGVGAKMNCCCDIGGTLGSSSASKAEVLLLSVLRLPAESGGFIANAEVEQADFGVVGNDLYDGDFGVGSVKQEKSVNINMKRRLMRSVFYEPE